MLQINYQTDRNLKNLILSAKKLSVDTEINAFLRHIEKLKRKKLSVEKGKVIWKKLKRG